MNPIYRSAADLLQGGQLMGAMTVVFAGFFVAWAAWAWAPRNRALMESAARIPLDDSVASSSES